MDFIKKHYEKILLAVVLLGVTVAVGFLLIYLPQKQQRLKEITEIKLVKTPKPLDPVPTNLEDAALQKVQAPFALDLTGRHNLFNPVLWMLMPDGRHLKVAEGNEIGPRALKITAINPLFVIVAYQAPQGKGYIVTVDHEALKGRKAHLTTVVSSESGPADPFILQKVDGPPDNPTALHLQFRDSGESFTLTPGQPYRRAEAYKADLTYPPDPSLRPWTDKRVDDILNLGGADYKITSITESNIVVSAKSNNKKFTIPFNPANQPR